MPGIGAILRVVAGQCVVAKASNQGTHDRRNEEQPHLRQRLRAGIDGNTKGTGRVHGGIGHRNGDQVDQRKREADGQRRKTSRCPLGSNTRITQRKTAVGTASMSSAAIME